LLWSSRANSFDLYEVHKSPVAKRSPGTAMFMDYDSRQSYGRRVPFCLTTQGVMVKVRPPDVPPPGAVLETVTWALPIEAMSPERTTASSFVLLR
jgi:hypothetical protein